MEVEYDEIDDDLDDVDDEDFDEDEIEDEAVTGDVSVNTKSSQALMDALSNAPGPSNMVKLEYEGRTIFIWFFFKPQIYQRGGYYGGGTLFCVLEVKIDSSVF